MKRNCDIIGFLILIMVSCTNKKDITQFEKERFSFQLAKNCIHKNSDYLDSEYGEIECPDYLISYDYGYCIYSFSEAHSRQDFIRQNRWLIQVIPKLVPKGEEILLDTIIKKIKILTVDEDQLKAEFEFADKVFEHNISIPLHLSNLFEKSDTTNDIITRIIYDRRSMNEITCYKINTSKPNLGKTCYESLIIRINSGEPLDSSIIFNFLKTVKFPVTGQDDASNK